MSWRRMADGGGTATGFRGDIQHAKTLSNFMQLPIWLDL